MLLANIDEPRQTAFSRQTSGNREKFLLTLEFPIAFNLTQSSASYFSRGVPRLGYRCHVPSHVFTHQQSQSTLRDQTLIIAMRNE